MLIRPALRSGEPHPGHVHDGQMEYINNLAERMKTVDKYRQ